MKNNKTRAFTVVMMLCVLSLCIACQREHITLCKDGYVTSRIVIPAQATEVEKHSSKILQKYLKKITGNEFEIVTDEAPSRQNDINIGKVNRNEFDDINLSELEEDGYVISSKEGKLHIIGGTEKGTMYGVYGFLEKCLGCRKYTSKVSVIPSQRTLILDHVYIKEIPAFKFREILYKDTYDPEFMEWHALDRHQADAYGPGDWGLWCHSALGLVPPEKYVKDHPEYYCLMNGKRITFSDICWSNPEAFEIAYNNLKVLIEQNPDKQYWSVSQGDHWAFCQCPACSKAAKEAGSPQGAIIPFINKMAQKFPNKIISTLAYQFSTRPPKGIKIEKNVNIMLCNIMSPRHIPIEEGDSTFTADLKAWNKIHDNMIIWDYVIGFDHLVAPFPNLHTLQPNLQFLHKNGVKAMFEQASRETGGEFCELRGYLLSKLLWNPYQDINPIVDDFLNGYYGAAGEYIREYIDLMIETVKRTKDDLLRRDGPWENRNSFFTADMVQKYYAILDKAKEAVKYDSELAVRVMSVRNQMDYVVLDIAKREVTGPRGALEKVNGKWVIKKEIEDLLVTTMRTLNAAGVTRIYEWSCTPLEYIKEFHTSMRNEIKKLEKAGK